MSALTADVGRVLRRWARWDSGSRTRLNTYWRGVMQADPELRDVRMCFEVLLGDRLLRFATVPIRTTSNLDDTEHAYSPWLQEEPALEEVSDIGDAGAAARSLQVSIATDAAKPAELIRRGRFLSGRVEVSLQVDGQDHDLRYVLLRGAAHVESYGSTWVALQLQDARLSESRRIPEYVVRDDVWPDVLVDDHGKRGPLVINGFDRVPALRVVDDHPGSSLKFLAATDHDLDVSTVYVNGTPYGTSDPPYQWSASEERDGEGRQVLLVDFSSSDGPWEDRDAVHVSLDTDTGVDRLPLVQVMRRLLRGYTDLGSLGMHPTLFARAEARLPSLIPEILVNGSGSKARGVLEFIEGSLLAEFPMVRLAFEGRGLGPVVLDRRVGVTGHDGDVSGGVFPLIDRVSDYQPTRGQDTFNEFEVRYKRNLISDGYEGLVRRTAEDSPACTLNQQQTGGVRSFPPLESTFIHDDRIAEYVIDWLVSHFAVPSQVISWRVNPWAFLRWRRGDNLRYTDDEFGYSDATATVIGKRYHRSGCEVTFRVWNPWWTASLG